MAMSAEDKYGLSRPIANAINARSKAACSKDFHLVPCNLYLILPAGRGEVRPADGKRTFLPNERGVRMAVDFEAVTQVAKRYADDVRRVMPVDKVMLFGSYAKGTAEATSDIDICFFLDSYGGKKRMDILKKLLWLTEDYDGAYFEPIVFETSELENDNPFVKEILRTGKEIL
jgi:uncharacterized protein